MAACPVPWRMKERTKTAAAVLLVCLNIGVDPPDLVRTDPSATVEAWVDPLALPVGKALDQIAKNLQVQYEVWQPRARYKVNVDPSAEEAKKACSSSRRTAKDDRILFHYNGHGVPMPTANGELWVFNKTFTQYIPLSIHDIQQWVGAPNVFVFDCSRAGNLLQPPPPPSPVPPPSSPPPSNRHGPASPATAAMLQSSYMLAACGADEELPLIPGFPADVFTSCLTTPIEMGLHWFLRRSPMFAGPAADIGAPSSEPAGGAGPRSQRALNVEVEESVRKIPGKINDRKSPLGELHWIFTAITDTIAWDSLSFASFRQLFRQDLLVAALFRNFLLAGRVMRSHGVTPQSVPALPESVWTHELWESWELVMDLSIAQLSPQQQQQSSAAAPPQAKASSTAFFEEQLTAFEFGLRQYRYPHKRRLKPPLQLPIVLQVLLSQAHRQRALMLLSRYINLGHDAVHESLRVGIFPYVCKLLLSTSLELRPALCVIWAKLLAIEGSVIAELAQPINGDDEHSGWLFFDLQPQQQQQQPPPASRKDASGLERAERVSCLFVLAQVAEQVRGAADVMVRARRLAEKAAAVLREPLHHECEAVWALVLLSHLAQVDGGGGVPVGTNAETVDLVAGACLGAERAAVRATAVWLLGALCAGLDATAFEDVVARTLGEAALDGSVAVRREALFWLASLVCSEPEAGSEHALLDDGFFAYYASFRRSRLAHMTRSRRSMGGGAGSGAASGAAGIAYASLGGGGGKKENKLTRFAQWASGSLSKSNSLRSLSSLHGRAGDRSAALSANSSTHTSTSTSGSDLAASGKTARRRRRRQAVYASLCHALLYLTHDPHAQTALEAAELLDRVNVMAEAASHAAPAYALGSPLSSPPPTSALLLSDSDESESIDESGGETPAGTSLPLPLTPLTAPLSPPPLPASLRKSSTSITALSASGRCSSASTDGFPAPTRSRVLSPASTLLSTGSARRGGEGVPQHLRSRRRETAHAEFVAMDLEAAFGAEAAQQTRSGGPPSWQQQEEREPAAVEEIRSLDKVQTTLDLKHAHPTACTFHGRRGELMVADRDNRVTFWSLGKGAKIKTVDLGLGTRNLLSLRYVTHGGREHVLGAVDDGTARLYAFDTEGELQLQSSWRTVKAPSAVEVFRTVDEWIPWSGYSVHGGACAEIFLWDLQRELCAARVATGSGSDVSALSCGPKDPGSKREHWDTIVAGFGNGIVSMYDYRNKPSEVNVLTLQEHQTSIVGVHRSPQNPNVILSGCSEGFVRFWDVRNPQGNLRKIRAHSSGVMTDFVAHETQEIFATSGSPSSLHVLNYNGAMLSNIRHHEGFLNRRIGHINCIAFHPTEYLLAAGTADSWITTYRGEF